MARKQKYSYGDNQRRKAQLFYFEKELQQYVKDYSTQKANSSQIMLQEEEELLVRIERKEYQQNPRLLPLFYFIPWQKQELRASFQTLQTIWEKEDERRSTRRK